MEGYIIMQKDHFCEEMVFFVIQIGI